MPRAPSIVPEALDQDIYLLLDDFGGRLGRAWRETDADRETVIRNLLAGGYNNPVCIIAFNIAEGWCRDVTLDVADELRLRVLERADIPEAAVEFLIANRR
jgi:hypothetical protein